MIFRSFGVIKLMKQDLKEKKGGKWDCGLFYSFFLKGEIEIGDVGIVRGRRTVDSGVKRGDCV